MCTLRSDEEVRETGFDFSGPVDKEMVALAESIVEKMRSHWYPAQFEDHYQKAIRG